MLERAEELSPFNRQVLESIRRPEWVYRGQLPQGELHFRRPRPIAEDDLTLCGRLIAAYAAAAGGRQASEQAEGMWSWIIDARQRALAEVLEAHDTSALASMLASMFQSRFILGIAYGDLCRHSDESPLAAHIWWLKALDGLLSLAEATGAVPAEGPEQGVLGQAFENGIADVVQKTEDQLGISIDFPDVGAPYGLMAADKLIPLESPEQIYAAMRLRDAMRLHLQPKETVHVVEIGGGYGGMAYWFLQLQTNVKHYSIVDLPTVNVLQGYFLSKVLGTHAVSFFGETPAQVVIVPDSELRTLAPCDVLVNKDSFPEMPEEALSEYLAWAHSKCTGIAYSYNQETAAPFLGVRQNLVPEAMRRVGNFTRLRRDCSWLRRGYVEEVYARGGPPGAATTN
jgi:hypothetical protein